MSKRLNVSIVQMNTSSDQAANIATALRMIQQAVSKDNAHWVLLPEVYNYRGDRAHVHDNADELPGRAIRPLMKAAKDASIYILAGSVIEKGLATSKVYNTSVLINPKGEISHVYRKLHLFDANVNGTTIRESDMYLAGDLPVVAKVSDIPVGLSICYDLRFPELFRYYSKKGAQIITVPSSFTTPTGEAHWEVLLRARAIENHAFVIAPNQIGVGAGKVATYGNSMIIDPWGTVIARGSEFNEEVVSAQLDLESLANVRNRFPSLENRRQIDFNL